jgi:hypothetical protein
VNQISCRGEVRVALPPAAAAELFTPEGERAWAPGWDPSYPVAGGPVFVTARGDRETTWITLDDLRYARVTPGVQAGTISVDLRADGDGTIAEVRYDLTSLHPDADHELDAFAAGFVELMADWERWIAEALRE